MSEQRQWFLVSHFKAPWVLVRQGIESGSSTLKSSAQPIHLFTLYVPFSQFRPRNVFQGISFCLFINYAYIGMWMPEHKTKCEENSSLGYHHVVWNGKTKREAKNVYWTNQAAKDSFKFRKRRTEYSLYSKMFLIHPWPHLPRLAFVF